MNYKTAKLSEVADISIGKTPSRNNPKYWDKNKESKNVWLSIRDMSKINDKFIDDSRECISNEGAKLFDEVPKGTLIMSFKLSIGKLAITKTNLRTNEAIAAFKIKDNLIISRDYLYYFLKSIDWDRFAGDDIKVKGKTLNKAKLKEVLISFPKLEEQQRIVSIFDKTFNEIGRALELAESQSAQLEKLKLAILKEFLVDDATKWNFLPFESCLSKVKTPFKLQKKHYLDKGEFPVVSQEVSLISGYHNNAENVFKIDKSLIAFGDHTQVLKYIDFDFVMGADGVKLLLPVEEINTKYFYYVLQQMMPKTTGYARHFKLLKELKIPVPPLKEQQRIVTNLDSAFAHLTATRNAITKKKGSYLSLKSSILSQKIKSKVA